MGLTGQTHTPKPILALTPPGEDQSTTSQETRQGKSWDTASGWVEDFHLRTVAHARRTTKKGGPGAALEAVKV